ncbi:hypothetical protein [Stieleria sedimenti]|nr:hypothetical protein [Stieleria sedimenti]
MHLLQSDYVIDHTAAASDHLLQTTWLCRSLCIALVGQDGESAAALSS